MDALEKHTQEMEMPEEEDSLFFKVVFTIVVYGIIFWGLYILFLYFGGKITDLEKNTDMPSWARAIWLFGSVLALVLFFSFFQGVGSDLKQVWKKITTDRKISKMTEKEKAAYWQSLREDKLMTGEEKNVFPKFHRITFMILVVFLIVWQVYLLFV